jgi:chemotaxis protein CheX
MALSVMMRVPAIVWHIGEVEKIKRLRSRRTESKKASRVQEGVKRGNGRPICVFGDDRLTKMPITDTAPAPVSPEKELSNVVRSVFDIMVGLDVDTPEGQTPLQDGVLTAVVHITGRQTGAVVIHCPMSQACKFTGRFLCQDAPVSVNDEVLDVLGELANMIAGNIKCKLMPEAQLSIPSVIEGTDGLLTMLWKDAQRTMFNTEVGAFWVSITLAMASDQQQLSAIQARAAELAKRLS